MRTAVVFCANLVCAGVALVLMSPLPAAAEEAEYIRGYVEALLDTRFPEAKVSVLTLDAERRETVLTARDCLTAEQRQDIERTLLMSQRVLGVHWQDAGVCNPAATPAPPAAQAPEPVAPNEAAVELLPEQELFKPLIADPRQPQFSIRYQYYNTPVETFNAASVSFGDYFGFAARSWGTTGITQLGLQGAVFALFNLDAPSFDLINADYWIGLPVTYRTGHWSFLGRIYHQSSHLGDEFLLGQPGTNRINLSYEDLELLGSYEWAHWRLYGGGGYIVHSEPELEPKHLQLGLELTWPRIFHGLDFLAAADSQASEERDWARSNSYQVGFGFIRHNRQVRLMLEHFDGFSPNGQFYRERLRYTGLGVYFDL